MTESFIWQQAGDEEFLRANQLRRVSLFIELNLDSDEIARSQELFGRLIHAHRNSVGIERLIERFPALTLTTLIGHAGLAYEKNRYWESFWAELDLTQDAEFENLLRAKLRRLLGSSDCASFPSSATNMYR